MRPVTNACDAETGRHTKTCCRPSRTRPEAAVFTVKASSASPPRRLVLSSRWRAEFGRDAGGVGRRDRFDMAWEIEKAHARRLRH